MVTTLYPELSLPPLAFYFSLLVTVYLISTILATKGLIESVCRVMGDLKDRNIEDVRGNPRHAATAILYLRTAA